MLLAVSSSAVVVEVFHMISLISDLVVQLQLREAAAAALARLQQEKAPKQPDVPGLEERVSATAARPTGAPLL